jgi:hypothetical protein
MEEGDPLAFRTRARLLVNQPDSRLTTARQRRVQVVHRKADVVNARAALFQEPANGGVGFIWFEKLNQGVARDEPADPRPVAVSQLGLGHSQDIAIE